MQTQEFGCQRCWPGDAGAAWERRKGLAPLREIDESHFHVTVLGCPECDQSYLSVFTELVDWADGEDPQHWALLPITPTEADTLVEQAPSLDEASLNALAPGRRCLRRDYPKAGSPRVFWATGMRVGPHD